MRSVFSIIQWYPIFFTCEINPLLLTESISLGQRLQTGKSEAYQTRPRRLPEGSCITWAQRHAWLGRMHLASPSTMSTALLFPRLLPLEVLVSPWRGLRGWDQRRSLLLQSSSDLQERKILSWRHGKPPTLYFPNSVQEASPWCSSGVSSHGKREQQGTRFWGTVSWFDPGLATVHPATPSSTPTPKCIVSLLCSVFGSRLCRAWLSSELSQLVFLYYDFDFWCFHLAVY